MASLKELSARVRTMPSQGAATTYGELRVHTQPARGAPSFLALKAGDKVDVLANLTAPRSDTRRQPLVPPAPKQPKKPAQKSAKPAKYPPRPCPSFRGPRPIGWASPRPIFSDEPAPDAAAESLPPAAPTPTDDWSLVRTAGGQAGWALTRALSMAIPDEVAQYAEGHRIVSYFALGEIADGDQKKQQWLWTTIGGGTQPYDFDSFRVFVWSNAPPPL